MQCIFARLFCCWLVSLCLACSGQPAALRSDSTPTPMASSSGVSAFAQIAKPAIGQIIYVPAYSHIYYQDQQRVIDLAVTLSIRNTAASQPLQIDAVQYYDSGGQFVRSYVNEPIRLGALASTAFVVEEEDARGGVGASFIVAWSSEQQITAPVVEAVMISAASTQGISFISVGRVLEEYPGINTE